MMQISILSKAKVAFKLGIGTIAAVALYRLGLKLGVHPVCRISGDVQSGPFFRSPAGTADLPASAGVDWMAKGELFSFWPIEVSGTPPDWLANAMTGKRAAGAECPWWKIQDFDPEVGDIKLVWELSRMDWVPGLAQQASAGNEKALQRMNAWLGDWCGKNPPYYGPNWKCGQEASIRVMHLAVAALLLDQVQSPEAGLRELVRLHLKRIAPTVGYAKAQNNNHGTSEAAALFIGGSWLAALGERDGAGWAGIGRRMLEERVQRLVGAQGTFSQYSLNYHRLMLDTLSLAETWRRLLGLPEFSSCWQGRALAASEWLRHMVDPLSGEAPNVGHNDGARLLQLDRSPYRDFRPSVQLATALFAGKRAYAPEGIWDHTLRWLGVPLPDEEAGPVGDYIADDGGFAVFRRGPAMVLMRYPRFRFRPGQADALHLDLWLNGRNLLRDGGSYSYFAGEQWTGYFGGVESHNTVQFDGRDQMPRLGRFLFGSWLKTERLERPEEKEGGLHFAVGYRDWRGARHIREIMFSEARLRVVDKLSDFERGAMLRWRLMPGLWTLEQDEGGVRVSGTENQRLILTVKATMPIVRAELSEGWESLHYNEKTPLPVLEVEVEAAGSIITDIEWLMA